MNFKGVLEDMPLSNVYNRHIKIPLKISTEWFKTTNSKRTIASLNDTCTYHCGFLPYGDGSFFINVNKEICKKLKIEIGETVEVKIEIDNSKYGIFLPEEMEVLLEQDTEGSNYFHLLTPGKQRSLLHIVGKPKSSDIRLQKAIITLEYLKMVKGKLDFKELIEAYKKK